MATTITKTLTKQDINDSDANVVTTAPVTVTYPNGVQLGDTTRSAIAPLGGPVTNLGTYDRPSETITYVDV